MINIPIYLKTYLLKNHFSTLYIFTAFILYIIFCNIIWLSRSSFLHTRYAINSRMAPRRSFRQRFRFKEHAFSFSPRSRRVSLVHFTVNVTRLVSGRHLRPIVNKVGGCRWRIDRGMRDSAEPGQSLS